MSGDPVDRLEAVFGRAIYASWLSELPLGAILTLPQIDLALASKICDAAAKMYVGRAFVARVSPEGVRVWRTM